MAKRGSWWFWPFHDTHLVAQFRESHPAHADILQCSINSKLNGTVAGSFGGFVTGYLACMKLENRLVAALPSKISVAQILLRVTPPTMVCIAASVSLGAHIGYNWVKGKYPPQVQEAEFHEAEAKFHDWLQRKASEQSRFQQ